jgi:membrane associated rhomboid family serine protease
MFLHADIYHVTFNMLFLWIFGGPVEERTGRRNYLIYYFGAGLAAGFLNIIMEVISRPDSTVPCIGASGAVSGIMALFLYRCFYSKLKLVISPILLPRQVNVPVIPLVLFWISQDVLLGFLSLSRPTGVAHWAHVGGFIFGIVIGRIKRYGQEGRIEQLRGRILKKLEEGGGWRTAEKDLLKLLDLAPDDPEVNHDLARLYANNDQLKQAEKHYQVSIQRYFTSDPSAAAYTVIEALDTLSKPMGIQYHLKAAETLIGVNEYEDAHKVLLPVLQCNNKESSIVERGLVVFLKLCQHLGKTEDLYEGVRIFMETFPKSKYRIEAKAIMSLKAGEVFMKADTPTNAPQPGKKQEEREAGRLGAIEFVERIIADPVLWAILLFMNIATPFLFPGMYAGALSPVYIFAASFVMTIIHRMGSISDILSHLSGPSEKKACERVNLEKSFNVAVLAEKRSQYAEATELYKELLTHNPKHVQARFNLARIYDMKLNDARNAKLHYQELMKVLPMDHPFRRDALDSVKRMGA